MFIQLGSTKLLFKVNVILPKDQQQRPGNHKKQLSVPKALPPTQGSPHRTGNTHIVGLTALLTSDDTLTMIVDLCFKRMKLHDKQVHQLQIHHLY